MATYGTGNQTIWTNNIPGYSTTVTAAGTTTLTSLSNYLQVFTGTTTQTVKLPVTTTIANGMQFEVHNRSTGIVTVQTGGAATITTVIPQTSMKFTCNNSATDVAASWYFYPPLVLDTAASPPYPIDRNSGCWYGLNTKANSFADTNAVTFGQNAKTGAANATAAGTGASATGAQSAAMGTSTLASGSNSTAIGSSAQCQGNDSMAMGSSASVASGVTRGTCIGTSCVLQSGSSTCIGNGVSVFTSANTGSIAIGKSAQCGVSGSSSATTFNTIAIGNNTKVQDNTEYGIAIGAGANIGTAGTSTCQKCIAIGPSCNIASTASGSTNDYNIVIGNAATTANTVTNGTAIGNGATVNVSSGLAIGAGATANAVGGAGTGTAGFALVVPTDTKTTGAPGATTDALIILINGVRYKIALTAF